MNPVTFDRDVCERAYFLMRHDPIDLTEAHFAQLTISGDEEPARDRQHAAQLALVEKRLTPTQTASAATAAPTPSRKASVTYGAVASMLNAVVEQLTKAMADLSVRHVPRAEFDKLETEVETLRAEVARRR